MSINDIILYIMVGFMVLGAIDRIIGNKFGLGEKFEEGIMAMGALAVAMVGVISMAPVLARWLSPVVVPLYTALGADPAMFATTLLANDMGGYPLAMSLALTPEAGQFAGIILGAMLGPTIVFTIPVALGIISKDDHKALAKGVLAGLITIPIGCFAGGVAAGFPLAMIMANLVPIIIVSGLLAAGLAIIPQKMINGFVIFGKGVVIVITIGLAAIIIETLTGIVVIQGMDPISEGFAVVGEIAIVLAGAFPMVHVITKVLNRPLMRMGKMLGMNDAAAAGMVATLANNIPMFGLMKDMDERGKVINVAFAVSASFILGDHLGYTAGVEREMIFSMIVGKFVGGVTAVMVAIFFLKLMEKKEAKA